MLVKPDIPDEQLLACLRDHYGLRGAQIAFLPIGNDVNTAVYRVVSEAATPYFLKLRRGSFDTTTVAIPKFLRDCGVEQVIAPIETRQRQFWARMDAFAVALFPFVEGQNGFASPLTDRLWIELGVALRGVHAAEVPPSLSAMIAREHSSSRCRHLDRALQARIEETEFADPIAAQMDSFLRAHRDTIAHMVDRADALGSALRAHSAPLVLCHADIHAANVLIDAKGALYLVDWDTLVFAPKERDLMFIGGGIGGAWNDPREAVLFYQGYGQTEINPSALAYYRYERFIEDIAEYCERLLRTDLSEADRETGLHKFVAAFQPGDVVEIARRTDVTR